MHCSSFLLFLQHGQKKRKKGRYDGSSGKKNRPDIAIGSILSNRETRTSKFFWFYPSHLQSSYGLIALIARLTMLVQYFEDNHTDLTTGLQISYLSSIRLSSNTGKRQTLRVWQENYYPYWWYRMMQDSRQVRCTTSDMIDFYL